MSQPASSITPEDIKSKLRDIQGEATEQVEDARNQLVTAGALLLLLLLIAAFILGRRGGKRASAVIEVRRGRCSHGCGQPLSRRSATGSRRTSGGGVTYLGENVRKSLDRDEVAVTTIRLRQGEQYTVVARPPATKAERQLGRVAGPVAGAEVQAGHADPITVEGGAAAEAITEAARPSQGRKPKVLAPPPPGKPVGGSASIAS